jgi:hypothetical protein
VLESAWQAQAAVRRASCKCRSGRAGRQRSARQRRARRMGARLLRREGGRRRRRWWAAGGPRARARAAQLVACSCSWSCFVVRVVGCSLYEYSRRGRLAPFWRPPHQSTSSRARAGTRRRAGARESVRGLCCAAMQEDGGESDREGGGGDGLHCAGPAGSGGRRGDGDGDGIGDGQAAEFQVRGSGSGSRQA